MTALYVLGAFLVLLLVGVVLAPLIEREPPDRELEELPPDERREAAVEALAEIEFEYRTDKLSDEDYRRLRTHYGRIALAEEEEEREGDGPEPGGEGPVSGPAEAAEDERRDEGAEAAEADAPRAPGGGGESRDAGRAGEPDARPSRSCSGCGTQVPEGARFCPGCGERVQGEHEEA